MNLQKASIIFMLGMTILTDIVVSAPDSVYKVIELVGTSSSRTKGTIFVDGDATCLDGFMVKDMKNFKVIGSATICTTAIDEEGVVFRRVEVNLKNSKYLVLGEATMQPGSEKALGKYTHVVGSAVGEVFDEGGQKIGTATDSGFVNADTIDCVFIVTID